MFFKIEHDKNFSFPNHYRLGKLFANTDNGWNTLDVSDYFLLYKGYADDCTLDSILHNRSNPVTGNYCIIEYNKSNEIVTIFSDKWRQYTMFYESGKSLSNYQKTDNPIWSDATVSFNQNLEFELDFVDLVGTFDEDNLSYNSVLDRTYNTLYSRVSNFLSHNTLPVKVFLSGGLDSTLVYSFVDKITKNYSHVFENHMEWDHFWMHNRQYIMKTHWGYNQIHHWKESCVLTTGAPGDEYFLRNPQTIDIWLSWHKIDSLKYFNDNTRYIQKYYFLKNYNKMLQDKNYQKLKQELMEKNKTELLTYFCNNVLNDSQHWHLGNTLTFTPLRDLDVFKTLIQMDPEDLREHVNGGQFSIDLISRNNPAIIDYLSDQKNDDEAIRNLHKLYAMLNQ